MTRAHIYEVEKRASREAQFFEASSCCTFRRSAEAYIFKSQLVSLAVA